MSESSSVKPSSIGRRLCWLLICALIGVAAGFAGLHYTDDPTWFLALPLVLATGWLVLADPTDCMPREPRGQQPSTGSPKGRNDAQEAATLRRSGVESRPAHHDESST